MQSLIGVFPNKVSAENAMKSLIQYGFNDSQVSVVLKENIYETSENGNKGGISSAQIASGIASGSLVGGIAGLLIGIGSFAIPGLGALLIAGPLAAAMGLTGASALTLSGAATGALAGGLAGGLVELGLSKGDANYYEKKVKEGGVILSVPVIDENSREEIERIFDASGAENIKKIDSSRLVN